MMHPLQTKKKKKNDDALHSLNSSDSSDFKDSDMNDVFNLNNNLIKSGTICGWCTVVFKVAESDHGHI